MLETLRSLKEQMLLDRSKKDKEVAARFNHSVAESTQWSPLVPGGTNIKIKEITLTELNQLKVVKSAGGIFIYSFCLIMGAGLLAGAVGGTTGYFEGEVNYVPVQIIMYVLGGVFFLVGAGGLFSNKNLVFDKAQGYCWEGNKSPRNTLRAEGNTTLIKLNRIKGLQIISEYFQSSKKKESYYSYELNLILDNGSRINVMDHGSQEAIRADAQKLSEYLEVPVFDAS